jgi:hypothetical protein
MVDVVPPERERIPPPVTVEPAASVSSMFLDRDITEHNVSIEVMVVPAAKAAPKIVSPMENLLELAEL